MIRLNVHECMLGPHVRACVTVCNCMSCVGDVPCACSEHGPPRQQSLISKESERFQGTTAARSKRDGSEKSFSGARPTITPTLTPGAMAWPKWHSAELSHRVRIAHHRARHERAHLPSPLQSHGSSPTALRSHVDCLAHRPLHWKARPILTLCPCVCVSR